MDTGQIGYIIDRNERICAVNLAWEVFALANSGTQLLPPAILGRSLWDFIIDDATRQLYRALLTSVRKRASSVRFRFRCDAPDARRLLQMQISAAGDGAIIFTSQPVRVQPRPAMLLLDAAQARSAERIPVCAWCMRVRTGAASWQAIEDAANALGLFEAPLLPQLSYTICPACHVTARLMSTDSTVASAGQAVFGELDLGLAHP